MTKKKETTEAAASKTTRSRKPAEPKATVAKRVPPTIQERILSILGEIGPVEKSHKNKDQNYSYRSIDDVCDSLNPLLAKHQVLIVPTVEEEEHWTEPRANGGKMMFVKLVITYTFYGPDGTFLEAKVTGSGNDTSDKAYNKAMTSAYKYVLNQVFCIPFSGQIDSEIDTMEMGNDHPPAQQRRQDPPAPREQGPGPRYIEVPGHDKKQLNDAYQRHYGLILSEDVEKLAGLLTEKSVDPECWRMWLQDKHGYDGLVNIKIIDYGKIFRDVEDDKVPKPKS